MKKDQVTRAKEVVGVGKRVWKLEVVQKVWGIQVGVPLLTLPLPPPTSAGLISDCGMRHWGDSWQCQTTWKT